MVPGRRAARTHPGGKVLIDAVGNEKLRVLGPIVAALGEAALLVAERLAMRLGSVLLDAMGVPGCPDLACWTASIESVRMVLIDN